MLTVLLYGLAASSALVIGAAIARIRLPRGAVLARVFERQRSGM